MGLCNSNKLTITSILKVNSYLGTLYYNTNFREDTMYTNANINLSLKVGKLGAGVQFK